MYVSVVDDLLSFFLTAIKLKDGSSESKNKKKHRLNVGEGVGVGMRRAQKATPPPVQRENERAGMKKVSGSTHLHRRSGNLPYPMVERSGPIPARPGRYRICSFPFPTSRRAMRIIRIRPLDYERRGPRCARSVRGNDRSKMR
jgi:hypothetical protein